MPFLEHIKNGALKRIKNTWGMSRVSFLEVLCLHHASTDLAGVLCEIFRVGHSSSINKVSKPDKCIYIE